MLKNLFDKEFNEHMETLKTNISQKLKTLAEEFGRYWLEITTNKNDFYRR